MLSTRWQSRGAARFSTIWPVPNCRWAISSIKLGIEQPSVSKHLRVLRDVGLVRVRRHGRHMLYRTNGEAIRPLHEWTKTFERLWSHQLMRIKERAEEKTNEVDSK